MVEHGTENPGVGGSTPPLSTYHVRTYVDSSLSATAQHSTDTQFPSSGAATGAKLGTYTFSAVAFNCRAMLMYRWVVA